MNLTQQQLNLLEQLETIQLPEPIGWWPLAFTWWVLIGSIIPILMGGVWYYREQKKSNAYRREAQIILQSIILNENQSPLNDQVMQINGLLKQVALTAYGRSKVASLNDQAWLEFMQTNCCYIDQSQALGDSLKLGYQKPIVDSKENQALIFKEQQSLQALTRYASQWIKGHYQ